MIKDGRAGMQLIQIMIVFGFGISSGGCDSRKDLNTSMMTFVPHN